MVIECGARSPWRLANLGDLEQGLCAGADYFCFQLYAKLVEFGACFAKETLAFGGVEEKK